MLTFSLYERVCPSCLTNLFDDFASLLNICSGNLLNSFKLCTDYVHVCLLAEFAFNGGRFDYRVATMCTIRAKRDTLRKTLLHSAATARGAETPQGAFNSNSK